MRTFEKSTKLNNVSYDVRGPVVDEAIQSYGWLHRVHPLS